MVIVLVPLVIAGDYGFDALTAAPWAYEILGKPTLTGSWTGTLRTVTGAQYAVYLEVDRSHFITDLHTRHGVAEVFGPVEWCARGVPSARSEVNGTINRSGSNVNLWADENILPAPDSFLAASMAPGTAPRSSWTSGFGCTAGTPRCTSFLMWRGRRV